MDSDGASNRRAALVSKPSDLEYNVMQLLLRRILTLIEAGVPTTAAATATALATAKSVIDATFVCVNTTIPGTVTTANANLALVLARFTGSQKVHPTLAAGVDVTADAAGLTLGAFAEVVAANAITVPFIIRGVNVQNSSLAATEYAEVVLYWGASDTEFARFFCQAGNVGFFLIPCPVIAANSKIRAKVSCNTANARIVTLSISYHA